MDAQPMDADIVCVGFGPAAGGFLTTLTRGIQQSMEAGTPIESRAMPGMPPVVLCYERADDISFGVSGVVTRGRAIRQSFPELNPEEIPLATRVSEEKLLYLLDPHGASRRPAWMKLADKTVEAFGAKDSAFEAPFTPDFLKKHDGYIFSLGQFNQWVGQQVMMTGLAQIWPATPVAEPLVEEGRVGGVVLAQDGSEVRSALTVVADGPVGPVGRRLDEIFGMPEGHERDEWAVGMKMVIDLPEACALPEGTVFHTIGYPEPEIFGFFYVHPGRTASAGIFVPSWLESPARTGYRYLQQFLMHPAIWKHIEGGRMRSWGAKSLLESGRRGEPWLAGDGYARIGEGSGSTNVLTGSGVDEAWLTGVQLAEGVLEILREGLDFSAANLKSGYIDRRRASWLDEENLAAERARNGFQSGLLSGFVGMGLAGLTGGAYGLPRPKEPKRTKSLEDFYVGRLSRSQLTRIKEECRTQAKPLHDALMDACGWPAVPFDGQLLVSHQDALLMGGKVQASGEFPDHVVFRDESVCERCGAKTCIEICSGEAIHVNAERPEGAPGFDREKCIHCGVCLWNCDKSNIAFCAAPGGLHSAEN
ncbi:MAG: 4Fe-4S ferredoxin [Bryobacter sp.]|nr:4Fe-4S ferredoxin [Bryobacter sp.]